MSNGRSRLIRPANESRVGLYHFDRMICIYLCIIYKCRSRRLSMFSLLCRRKFSFLIISARFINLFDSLCEIRKRAAVCSNYARVEIYGDWIVIAVFAFWIRDLSNFFEYVKCSFPPFDRKNGGIVINRLLFRNSCESVR